MDFWTITAFFGSAVGFFYAGLWFAAAHKPKDPRVVKIGKALAEAQIELADLRDLYERLLVSHKRLRSSAGMAKLRAVEKEDLNKQSEAEILSRLGLHGAKR